MKPDPIDDSALLHGGTYDPVKAREYYLRTRHLKGRRRAQARPPGPGRRPAVAQVKPKQSSAARRAAIEAEKAHLEKRLKRLKEVLRELVDAAKKRSGVDESKDTPKDKADRNAQRKKNRPLTAAQKRKKAKADKERYDKEHKDSPKSEIQQLRQQIQDIEERIRAAMAEAGKKRPNKTASKGR